jgi:hypothetical protein
LIFANYGIGRDGRKISIKNEEKNKEREKVEKFSFLPFWNLFVPQGFDRIQTAGAPGGKNSG